MTWLRLALIQIIILKLRSRHGVLTGLMTTERAPPSVTGAGFFQLWCWGLEWAVNLWCVAWKEGTQTQPVRQVIDATGGFQVTKLWFLSIMSVARATTQTEVPRQKQAEGFGHFFVFGCLVILLKNFGAGIGESPWKSAAA